jgi:hypothetical protein
MLEPSTIAYCPEAFTIKDKSSVTFGNSGFWFSVS